MGFKAYSSDKKAEKNINEQSKKVEDLYEKYKDKSEDELKNELFSEVLKQKQDGTFNYDYLYGLAQKVSPYLNTEQNTKINELLEKIK